MFYMQEFEIVKDGAYYLALPFDLEGGTQGESMEEVMSMTGEWLHDEMLFHLAAGRNLPTPTFGNEPQQGGRVVLVGMGASLADVPSVSASEAADILGVSRPRITKMLETGQLQGWKDGRNVRVSVESIELRKATTATAGRPRKTAVA